MFNRRHRYQQLKNKTYERRFNPYLATKFCPENVVCFLRLLHILRMLFRLDFFMEADNINPHQTAHAVPYCLQYTLYYRLPKNISIREEAETGGLKIYQLTNIVMLSHASLLSSLI